ncbi:hypothetical protein Tco_0417887 [Tanacetum coccineum]
MLTIVPHYTQTDDDMDEASTTPVQLGLIFSHTEKYPDEMPLLNVRRPFKTLTELQAEEDDQFRMHLNAYILQDYCVTASNRGHVLSAGLTTDPAFGLTGTMRSGSIYATHTCSPYEEIRILKKQNDDLKKKMGDAEAQRVADQLASQKTLNLPELLNRILEVDINKKTENQAKMTKLSMEWKRLCKIKAKVQKSQSQSQSRRINSQTGAGTEEYYWTQS